MYSSFGRNGQKEREPWLLKNTASSVQRNELTSNSFKKFLSIFFISLLVYLFTVSISSPIGSSADDNYHLPSIWCTSPDNSVICKEVGGKFFAPPQINGSNFNCYIIWVDRNVNQYDKTAKCVDDNISGVALAETDYMNQKYGQYPPVFYGVSHFFVDNDYSKSIIMIRIFWGFVFALFLLFAFYLLPQRTNFKIISVLSLFISPMYVYILCSTNPSSGALISLFFTPIFLHIFLMQKTHKDSVLSSILFSLSVLIGAGSRADAGVFILIVIIALITLHRKNIKSFSSLLLIIGNVVLIVYFVLTSGQSVSATKGMNGTSSFLPFNAELFISNLVRLPEYFAGFWGFYWGLGWKFEPPLNDSYLIFVSLVSTFVAYNFFKKLPSSTKKVLTFMILILAVLPLFMLQNSGATVGNTVQPRYLLPLAVSIFVLIALTPNTASVFSRPMNRKIFSILPAIVFFTSSVSTNFIMLQRNVNGISGPMFFSLNTDSWWWNNLLISPMFTFFLNVIASFGMGVFFYKSLRISFDPETSSKKKKTPKRIHPRRGYGR